MSTEQIEDAAHRGVPFRLKVACATVFTAACFITSLSAKEPVMKEFQLFHVPWPIDSFSEKTPKPELVDPFADPVSPDDDPEKDVHAVENPFGDILPGKLRSARPFLEHFGVRLSKSDIAWHHPASGLLIAEALPEDVELIGIVLNRLRQSPNDHLIVSGKFIETVKTKNGRKEIVLAGWETPCLSGEEIEISKGGEGPVAYGILLAITMGTDGVIFSYQLKMDALIKENRFEVNTFSCERLNHPVELILHRTPENGNDLRLELTLTDKVVTSVPPPPEEKEMQQLREKISKFLRNRSRKAPSR